VIYKGVMTRLLAPRKLTLEPVVIDTTTLGSEEIVAQTEYSAISPGTEIAAYLGAPPLRPTPAPYPRLVGYCNAAEIIHCGESVVNIKPGDRIITSQSHRSLFSVHQSKVMARIPESLASKTAVSAYLYHLGYNALLRGGIVPGCNIAVIGLGVLGLATVAMSKLAGACVYGISDHEKPRSIARSLHAEGAFSRKDALDLIKKSSSPTGIDLVVTTSNSWKDWKLALEIVRKNGTISVLGFPGRTEGLPDFNPLDSQHFYDKQLTLIAAGFSPNADVDASLIRFTEKRNMAYLIKNIESGNIDPSLLISGEFSGEEIESAYRKIIERVDSPITFLLKWS